MTVVLKRLLPFVSALIFGVSLVSLSSFVNSLTRDGDFSGAQGETHSRTWLLIRHLPAPVYTEDEARERGALHVERLRALLDADGTVSKVVRSTSSCLHGESPFTDDVIEAARRIRFSPATEDGQPVSLWVTVDYGCSSYHFAHRRFFQCDASIVEVERDWRTIYE